jgi:hypothetical protein
MGKGTTIGEFVTELSEFVTEEQLRTLLLVAYIVDVESYSDEI